MAGTPPRRTRNSRLVMLAWPSRDGLGPRGIDMAGEDGRRDGVRRRVAIAGLLLAAVVGACTGRGGGWLPPDGVAFAGKAVFGFSFSCERPSASTSLNPRPGRLRLELSYADQGANPIGSGFGIHGIADDLPPIVESQACIGDEPPELPGEPLGTLIFLGRYRLTSGSPAGFPSACPIRETSTTPLCRFEVIVRDNDFDVAPSTGDFFSIKLTTVTDPLVSDPPEATVFYARAGILAGGNLTVE
jgi:hypothetical protein